VYYLYAWLHLPGEQRYEAEFVVPTGNFGNVFAGWLLERMNVPIRGFRVATNQNDILHRFFQTGEYRVGAVRPSHAPSMDIQVASNFERFLYYLVGEEATEVRRLMAQLKDTGACQFDNFDPELFSSTRADDADIIRLIREVHQRHRYVLDPHTACGFQGLNPDRVSVVLATAHPAKFPEVLKQAIDFEPTHPALEALKAKPIVKHRMPASTTAIMDYIARHSV
jgi:threonine synthase